MGEVIAQQDVGAFNLNIEALHDVCMRAFPARVSGISTSGGRVLINWLDVLPSPEEEALGITIAEGHGALELTVDAETIAADGVATATVVLAAPEREGALLDYRVMLTGEGVYDEGEIAVTDGVAGLALATLTPGEYHVEITARADGNYASGYAVVTAEEP